MRKKIGVEVRRYATIIVEYDDDSDIPALVEDAIANDSSDLDWNEPEIDCIEHLADLESEEEDSLYDRAYEEHREKALFA